LKFNLLIFLQALLTSYFFPRKQISLDYKVISIFHTINVNNKINLLYDFIVIDNLETIIVVIMLS